ncbi:AcrR family transcriptional regulator [Pseudoclavibacter sp. JAI123]|uniref:TetR/AcrR family transcriptional regulator n=1 Tax=Pseudoclavibacter sp. JAI123 TaxID=2723065 RepID=UPI0015CC25FF|nr:TetR/AcrR family transcriptional regulator [Pseudoclavibacter sp. JAI123]NYF15063.1 AcrR family transcriptional regulator [Pseudoclavibacter sp. JAI123]
MSPRRYDSQVRDAAARETRHRVLEAARASFLAEGYSRTTVKAIAAAAGVSEQTVYSRIGGKAAILKAVYDTALAGDDAPIPQAERPATTRLQHAGDARTLLAEYAELATDINARLRPLLELVHGARAVEPDLDELARTGARERRFGTTMMAKHFVGAGFARPGLDEQSVLDLVWVLNSPEVYLLQVRENGLTDEQYRNWLTQTLLDSLTDRRGTGSAG